MGEQEPGPESERRVLGRLWPRSTTASTDHRDTLNPAAIARPIADLRPRLLVVLAEDNTEQPYLASIPGAPPPEQ